MSVPQMPHLHKSCWSSAQMTRSPDLVQWFSLESHTCPYWPGIKSQPKSRPVFTPFAFPVSGKKIQKNVNCPFGKTWRKINSKFDRVRTVESGGDSRWKICCVSLKAHLFNPFRPCYISLTTIVLLSYVNPIALTENVIIMNFQRPSGAVFTITLNLTFESYSKELLLLS